MTPFCHDRDLLIIEPAVFTVGAFRAQQLAAGNDGALAGTAFTSAAADFSDAVVKSGTVLCAHSGQLSEGICYEVVAVADAHTLTVSVPRASVEEPATPPAAGGAGLNWQVLTFGPQIARASDMLAERLRDLAEAAGIKSAEFADSAQLVEVTACLALASIYAAAAETADDSDARWTKSRHYAGRYAGQLQRLRLACDLDGDGRAETTRSLANVRLRRL